MKAVRLASEAWSHEPVMYAEGFLDRLLGLKALEPGSAVLLETSSVHGMGAKQPFRAVGLSADYEVMDVVTLRPRRAVRFSGCRYVVELPIEIDPPPLGARLEVNPCL